MCDECEALTNEVSGLLYTTRKQAQIIAGLEQNLRKLRQEDPESRQIVFVFSEWKALTGHLRAKIETGNRWDLIKRRLSGRGQEECIWCIRGMALAPWQHYGRYRLTPCGKQGCCVKRDDITDVFGHDARFDELRDIGHRSEQAPSEKLYEALERLQLQDRLVSRRLIDALNREAMDQLLAEADPEVQAGRTPAWAVVYDLQQKRVS